MNNTERKAKVIRDTVKTIIDYSNQERIQTLKRENYEEYVKHMESLFPEFNKTQPALLRLAIDGQNLNNMDIILNGLIDRSRGKLTKEEMEKKVGISIIESIQEENGL